MIDFSGIPRSGWVGRSLRAPLRLLPDDTPVRVLQGPLRGARWIAGSGTHGCWLGSYELEKQRLFAESVRKGDAVLDIGANVGFYTLLASRRAGPTGCVIAFEPLPRNLDYLRRHVTRNGCSNVRVIDAAVGATGGLARFTPGPDPSSGSIAAEGQLEVRVVSLDELRATSALPAPDLIKIDVEGGELDVLRGAVETLEAAKPVILLATHGDALRSRCVAFLEGTGYEVRTFSGARVDEDDEFIATPRPPHRSARTVVRTVFPLLF